MGDIRCHQGIPFMVCIPERTVTLLIGVQGSVVKSIQHNTGASVNVERRGDHTAGHREKVVTISGTKEQKVDALRRVIEIVVGAQHESPQQDLCFPFFVSPAGIHELDRMKEGSLQNMAVDLGIQITFSCRREQRGRVEIRGPMESLLMSAQYIHEIAGSANKKYPDIAYSVDIEKTTVPATTVQSHSAPAQIAAQDSDWFLSVPQSVVSFIIGPKGQVVMEMQRRSGATIDIPKHQQGDAVIIINGTTPQKNLALDLLLHQLASATEYTSVMPPVMFHVPMPFDSEMLSFVSSTSSTACLITDTKSEFTATDFVAVDIAGDIPSICSAVEMIYNRRMVTSDYEVFPDRGN